MYAAFGIQLNLGIYPQIGEETRRLKGAPATNALVCLDVTKLSPDVFHITGMLDAADLPTLRMALLDAAGNPAHDAQRPFAADDRSTWSNEALKVLNPQALAELTAEAGADFSSPLNTPLNILSLSQKHGTMATWDFFFPFDKYALTHTAGGINE